MSYWSALIKLSVCAIVSAVFVTTAAADTRITKGATDAFATHCFLPSMTSIRAERILGRTNARYDFYDLDPLFSRNAPSLPTGRAVTPGTDRRCEVSFDGNHSELAKQAALRGLEEQRISTAAEVPSAYQETAGTVLLAARRLNPQRVAVVHAGTRPGPNGLETFIFVERLIRSSN